VRLDQALDLGHRQVPALSVGGRIQDRVNALMGEITKQRIGTIRATSAGAGGVEAVRPAP